MRADLVSTAERAQRVLAVTYNYSGYPLIRQAKEMIAAGELGELRLVQVEYAQDWLTTLLEAEGQKQASWRTDPQQAGAAARCRRHRHARFPSRRVRERIARRAARGGSFDARRGPQARRQRADAAAFRERRARRAVGQPGRGRQRERTAPAHLRRERRTRMVAGRAESHAACAVRSAAARHRARRSGR